MKKILTGLLSAGLLLGSAIPVLAQNNPSTASMPTPVWRYARAYPGHPVTLEGNGVAEAHGRGKIRYQVTSGDVRITGRGVVAVKGNPTIEVHGIGFKGQIGGWTYYAGYGNFKATGSGYEVVFWGRKNTSVKGSGKATYRGFWGIRYHGLNTSGSHLDSIALPAELKSEAGADADLE